MGISLCKADFESICCFKLIQCIGAGFDQPFMRGSLWVLWVRANHGRLLLVSGVNYDLTTQLICFAFFAGRQACQGCSSHCQKGPEQAQANCNEIYSGHPANLGLIAMAQNNKNDNDGRYFQTVFVRMKRWLQGWKTSGTLNLKRSVIRPIIFLIFLSHQIQIKHQSGTIPEHQSTYVEPQYITSHHNNTKCSMYRVAAHCDKIWSFFRRS